MHVKKYSPAGGHLHKSEGNATLKITPIKTRNINSDLLNNNQEISHLIQNNKNTIISPEIKIKPLTSFTKEECSSPDCIVNLEFRSPVMDNSLKFNNTSIGSSINTSVQTNSVLTIEKGVGTNPLKSVKELLEQSAKKKLKDQSITQSDN